MLEHEGLPEHVRQFVAQAVGVRPERVRPGTRINYGLGVDGDDGVELLEAFAARFGVDMSGCEIGRYFGPEAGGNPLCWLLQLLDPRSRLVPLTVGDLAEAARIGQWRKAERDTA
jgi:hypothetical protein